MSEDIQGEQAQEQQSQIRIERLYLKDSSFESPGAPSIFTAQWQPQNQVDINTTVNSLGDDRHEVVLSATVTSRRDDEHVAFVVEVQYAGIFAIEGVNQQQRHQVLGIMCPNTLFPYVRETLDSLVVRGGFPALQMAPINFERIFAQAMQQQAAQQQAEATDTAVKH